MNLIDELKLAILGLESLAKKAEKQDFMAGEYVRQGKTSLAASIQQLQVMSRHQAGLERGEKDARNNGTTTS